MSLRNCFHCAYWTYDGISYKCEKTGWFLEDWQLEFDCDDWKPDGEELLKSLVEHVKCIVTLWTFRGGE